MRGMGGAEVSLTGSAEGLGGTGGGWGALGGIGGVGNALLYAP